MKLLGAGLPRTATTTQMIALEMLGLPCYHVHPNYAGWIDLLTEMNFGEERGVWAGTNGEPGPMAEAMERWNQQVIDTVPEDRLLVWNPKEGWEPLCEFLEVPVPDQPLPHVN